MVFMEEKKEDEVKIFPSDWFDQAEDLISKTLPPGDNRDQLVWIQNEISSRRLTLFRVLKNDELIGVFTARWSTMFNGEKHLLIIHCSAVEEGKNFLRTIHLPIQQIGKDLGCVAIKAHAQNKVIARAVQQVDGYELLESIYIKRF